MFGGDPQRVPKHPLFIITKLDRIVFGRRLSGLLVSDTAVLTHSGL